MKKETVKASAEEVEAFRERIRRRNEELATWVVVDTDEFIKAVETIWGK